MKLLNVSIRASMIAAVALGGLAAASVPAWAQGVTSERLVNANSEPQNWLLPYRDYTSRRFRRSARSPSTTSRASRSPS